MTPEIFVSTDIEADGPIPGPYSMLSLGSAAFLPDKTMLSTFSVNLETLLGASQHPDTMAFWAENPGAWAKCRENPQKPKTAIEQYSRWLKALPGRPVFVGYPAGFDFTFARWYMVNFTGDCPFGFSALDIKSMAMGLLGKSWRNTVKKKMPKEWFGEGLEHNHVALDDAIGQGILFCNVLAESRKRLGKT